MVFVRRGTFARRAGGIEALLDGTLAYFERPGTEEQFAHPAGHDDECLSLDLPDGTADSLAEVVGLEGAPAPPLYTSAAIDLEHRRLARLAERGCDAFELRERSTRLVEAVLERSPAARPFPGRPATAGVRRRLVSRVREALRDRPATGLERLAREVGASPHHLSRVFSDETGQTLSRYRNRLRVSLALARLEQGERDLARLAADLGFADQAHMTRVTRAELGEPPSQVRRLLRSD